MVVQLAVPVIMQGVINLGVNIMDTVMLAHYGEIQLSASSLAGGYINLFQILCMGIGCGAAVLTSQCWGRRDIVSLKKTVALMLRLALGISAVFTLLTWMVPGIIIRIYTPDAEIIEKGVLYLRWSVITFPLMGLSLTLTQVLRSIRNVRIPLAASIISFVANIFFNWVFIFGNLGAPEMQIAGAALGTSIARVIETIIIAGYMFFLENKIHFRLPALLEPCGSLLPTYLHYSLPVIISDSLLALGTNMVSVIMGHIGATFVATNVIASVVVRIATVVNQGVWSSSSTVTGNTLGRGEAERAYRQGITFVAMGVLIGLVGALIIYLVSPYVIAFYNVAEETEVVAEKLMDAVCITVVFQTTSGVLTKGVLRGGGDTRFLMVADIFFLWVVSVPLGAAAGLIWNLDPFWVYLCLKSEYIFKTILCLGRLLTKRWMRVIESA